MSERLTFESVRGVPRTVLELAAKVNDGEILEFRYPHDTHWTKAAAHGDFMGDYPKCQYRTVPPKPQPSLSPWTPEECPVGALLRKEHCWPARWVILGAYASGILNYIDIKGINVHISFQDALDSYQHSTDCGKSWLPCGVLEEQS